MPEPDHLDRARELMRTGELAQAANAVELAPGDYRARVAFGQALLRRNRRRRALRELKIAHDLAPSAPLTIHALSIAQAAMSPASSVAALLPVALRSSGDKLAAYNLRVTLGRVILYSQLVVFGAGVLAFVAWGVQRNLEVGDPLNRIALGVIALATLAVVGRIFGPLLGLMLASVVLFAVVPPLGQGAPDRVRPDRRLPAHPDRVEAEPALVSPASPGSRPAAPPVRSPGRLAAPSG